MQSCPLLGSGVLSWQLKVTACQLHFPKSEVCNQSQIHGREIFLTPQQRGTSRKCYCYIDHLHFIKKKWVLCLSMTCWWLFLVQQPA